MKPRTQSPEVEARPKRSDSSSPAVCSVQVDQPEPRSEGKGFKRRAESTGGQTSRQRKGKELSYLELFDRLSDTYQDSMRGRTIDREEISYLMSELDRMKVVIVRISGIDPAATEQEVLEHCLRKGAGFDPKNNYVTDRSVIGWNFLRNTLDLLRLGVVHLVMADFSTARRFCSEFNHYRSGLMRNDMIAEIGEDKQVP